MNLKALKIKIGIKNDGAAKYPDFNQLQTVKDSGMDWSRYVDVQGDGWHYDKKYSHKDVGPDSPRGEQWGVLLVPSTFVTEAVAMYPDECAAITETAFKTFYDDRVAHTQPAEKVNTVVIGAITAKQNAGITLSPNDLKALDLNDETPGITKNPRKTYDDYKAKKGFTIAK